MSALFVFCACCNRQGMCFNELPPFPATGSEVFTWEQAGGEESRPSVCSARDREGDPGQNSKLPNRPPGETHRHTDALTVCCELQHMLLANTSERHPWFSTSHSYKPAMYCTFFLFTLMSLMKLISSTPLKVGIPQFFCQPNLFELKYLLEVRPENISVIYQYIYMPIFIIVIMIIASLD